MWTTERRLLLWDACVISHIETELITFMFQHFRISMPDFFPHELNFCFFQCAHQGESALWFILLRSINSAMIKKDWIIFYTNQILVTVSFWIISWMPVGNIWYIYIAFMLITARWRWWCCLFCENLYENFILMKVLFTSLFLYDLLFLIWHFPENHWFYLGKLIIMHDLLETIEIRKYWI